jgi:glycosyltransferase involved in cell wall biosynthesis
MSDVTVLIPVYAGANAVEFDRTLASLWSQTSPAEQVLVVKDGPLTPELEAVLDQHRRPALTTYSLAQNQGAGPALQAGLETITTTYVARIDADDVAFPERLDIQRRYLDAHPDIAVVGTAVQEFDDATLRETGDLDRSLTKVRSLPETHDEIARYAMINTPVNHPSVMARTEALDAAGGYRPVHHMEDYDLWARMLADGRRFHNLPEPLTYFRTSTSQFERRTKGMFAAERQMQRNLVSYGLISRPRAVFNLVARTAYRLLPTGLLTRVYGALFHK